MFVPGEHFVAAALEHDPELWDFAFRNKVLLATPTNLVAIARTVAQVWRQDGLATRGARDRHAWAASSTTGWRSRPNTSSASAAGSKRRSATTTSSSAASSATSSPSGKRLARQAHRDRQARDRRSAAGRKRAALYSCGDAGDSPRCRSWSRRSDTGRGTRERMRATDCSPGRCWPCWRPASQGTAPADDMAETRRRAGRRGPSREPPKLAEGPLTPRATRAASSGRRRLPPAIWSRR